MQAQTLGEGGARSRHCELADDRAVGPDAASLEAIDLLQDDDIALHPAGVTL